VASCEPPLRFLHDDETHPLSSARLPEWGSMVLLLQPGLPNDVAYRQLIRPTDIVHVTGGAPGTLMISHRPRSLHGDGKLSSAEDGGRVGGP
jgi:hypothetical protein